MFHSHYIYIYYVKLQGQHVTLKWEVLKHFSTEIYALPMIVRVTTLKK